MKITKETFATLQILESKGINLTDFYCVRINNEEILLQGNFSSVLLRKCKEAINDNDFKQLTSFLLKEEGWIMAEVEINGVKIEITLT